MFNQNNASNSNNDASYRKPNHFMQGEEGIGGGLAMTATKKNEQNDFYSQVTPRPQKKILLYGENKSRHLFPLVRDRDIGIEGTYQNVVIESVKIVIFSAMMMIAKQQVHSYNEE